MVRITVDREEAAKAVPYIRDNLAKMNIEVPLVGDFHYIGHTLLNDHPAMAEALANIGLTLAMLVLRKSAIRNSLK